MPQSFGFGFNDEDIEADGDEETSVARESEEPPDETPQTEKPTLHPIQEMLSTLPDSLSYNTVEQDVTLGPLSQEPWYLPRRELFDIRAQLMVEDTGLDQSVTASLSTDDITPNIYEGGFKTWECSVDLASFLTNIFAILPKAASKTLHIVELGAGTGLPALSFFRHMLLDRSNVRYPSMQLTVTDYNSSVLQLSTIPNLLIGWATDPHIRTPSSGDLKVTSELQQRFIETLHRKNINVSAISGGWSPALVHMIMTQYPSTPRIECDTIILASETIYSPSTIRPFTSTLLSLLHLAEARGARAKALIAAKRVYFGVGGGVDEFLAVLTEMGGEGEVEWESEGEGVGRVILEVKLTNKYDELLRRGELAPKVPWLGLQQDCLVETVNSQRPAVSEGRWSGFPGT